MHENPGSRFITWLSYGVLLAGVGAAVASAYLVITTYSPLPCWDEWAVFDHLASGGGWSLSWLWAQHNEHRLLIPKIFFLLDVQFFRGRQIFLLTTIYLVQLFQICLLSWSLRVLGRMRGSAWRVGTGLIAYCVLCPTQYENFVWGFQLQFVIPAAMATLAVVSLLVYYREKAEQGRGRGWLIAISITAATMATWSLANGMLLWPLLVVTAWWLPPQEGANGVSLHAGVDDQAKSRFGNRGRLGVETAALLVCGAVNIALYLFHYHRPLPESGVVQPHLSFGERVHYVIVYFGSTFVRHSSGTVALVAGSLGICVAFFVVACILRQHATASPLSIELSFLMTMCLATAVVTSSGRLHFGVQQATSSRYQTFALIFWCCLGLMLLVRVERRRAPFQAFAVVLLLMMLGFATQVRLPLIDAQWHQLRLKLISLALVTGVHDPAALADAYPDPQAVLRAADYMKQHRLSVFAGAQFEQLGQPLDAAYRLRPKGDCSGFISSSQVLPADSGPGVRVTGYALDRESQRPVRDVLAVIDGRISGFGTNVSLTSDRFGVPADLARNGWIAFVRDTDRSGKVEFYAIEGKHGSSVCPFVEISP